MEGFCRGCLIKYDDPEELLEYTEKNRRLFIYSTGLQVKRNDIFTFQLCKDCYVNMQQSCKFKKLCRLSDKKFRTYLSLKDAGETLDLCAYLKNNDDNFYLRWAGNSTPANQKRDDDNESTCTSIRNFMQDMLQDTEMPDSEAGIIRQVIEEEADVLDDSLDSHWLQDDVSIATDFRLDFSPFSTPRSVSNDHCYTPMRPPQTPEVNHFGILNLESPNAQSNDNNQRKKPIHNRPIDDILSDSLLDNSFGDNFDNNVKSKKVYDEKEIKKIENNLITEQVDCLDDQIDQMNIKNYYVDNTLIEEPTLVEQSEFFVETPIPFSEQSVPFDDQLTFVNQSETCIEQPVTFVQQPVKIVEPSGKFVEQPLIFGGKNVRGTESEYTDDVDRRLNEALQSNDPNKEISLQELLGSPAEYPTSVDLSTPTINNILFGDKLDENSSQDQIGHASAKSNDVQGDKEQYSTTIDVKIEPSAQSRDTLEKPISESHDIEEEKSYFYSPENSDSESEGPLKVDECICDICDKKFKNKRALKIHSMRQHEIKMPRAELKKPKLTYMVCNECGKEFTNKRNFKQHVLRHNILPDTRCEVCGLKFRTERKYQLHRATHFGQRLRDVTKEKATCEICKKTMLKTSLKKHVLKHARMYIGTCDVCGRGYYTLTELREHMREHTGERPHACEVCGSAFPRRNSLIRHMRLHTGEIRYFCDNCNKRYANKTSLICHIQSGRCSDFKTTGKLKKIKRRRPNVVTILKIQNEAVLKPYKCVFCHSRHKTKNMLISHQRKKRCKKFQEMENPPALIEIVDITRPCVNTQLEVLKEE